MEKVQKDLMHTQWIFMKYPIDPSFPNFEPTLLKLN